MAKTKTLVLLENAMLIKPISLYYFIDILNFKTYNMNNKGCRFF